MATDNSLNDLADEIEAAIDRQELNPCNVTSALVASCLTRLNTLKNARPATNLSNSACHLNEIDSRIQKELDLTEWSEKIRDELFDQKIATLRALSGDWTGKENDLAGAVIFLRAIVSGLDEYKLKISRARHH